MWSLLFTSCFLWIKAWVHPFLVISITTSIIHHLFLEFSLNVSTLGFKLSLLIWVIAWTFGRYIKTPGPSKKVLHLKKLCHQPSLPLAKVSQRRPLKQQNMMLLSNSLRKKQVSRATPLLVLNKLLNKLLNRIKDVLQLKHSIFVRIKTGEKSSNARLQ